LQKFRRAGAKLRTENKSFPRKRVAFELGNPKLPHNLGHFREKSELY
jgi:hypothetical protein